MIQVRREATMLSGVMLVILHSLWLLYTLIYWAQQGKNEVRKVVVIIPGRSYGSLYKNSCGGNRDLKMVSNFFERP